MLVVETHSEYDTRQGVFGGPVTARQHFNHKPSNNDDACN